MGAGGLVLRGRFALTFWGTLGDVVARFKPRWRDPTQLMNAYIAQDTDRANRHEPDSEPIRSEAKVWTGGGSQVHS